MAIDLRSLEKDKRKPQSNNLRAEKMKAILNTEISLFSRKLPDRKKEQFYSELGILLSSGLDIKTALEIIIDEQNKKTHQIVFTEISELVINGSSLSKALELNGNFTPYEVHSIQIGEETGKLVNVLNELAVFFENKIKQSKKVLNALSYPSLVLLTALAVVWFMLSFMVPMFKDIFKQFGNDLPGITKAVIAASEWFQNFFWLLAPALIGIAIFLYLSRKKTWYRKLGSALLLRLPVIGKTVRMVYTERFFQSFALLAASGIPMIRALELTGRMIAFYPIEKALKMMIGDVTGGEALHASMLKSGFFTRRVCALMKVAEEVNQIDRISEKLRKQYAAELEQRISLMSSLLEPLMIIFIGLLVAVILISMYLPMFKMSTTVY